jgi:hypothetical protein
MPNAPLRTLARVTTVLTCALSLVLAHAQPDTHKPAKLRFIFLDESAGAYSLKLGNHYQQISSKPYVISPVFTPADGERLDIYKTNTTPDPVTGKIERVKIAAFTPPTTTTSGLVVLTPRPAQPGTAPVYGVEFIDSSLNNFPLGSIRILNLGNVTMAAQFGTSQVVVQPGTSKIVQPAADRRFRILAKIAAKSAESWELRSDNLIILHPDERITGVFFYSPSGMIHTFTPDELLEHGPPPPGHFWLTYTDTP